MNCVRTNHAALTRMAKRDGRGRQAKSQKEATPLSRKDKRQRERDRRQRRVERRAQAELNTLRVGTTPSASEPVRGAQAAAIDPTLHWHVARLAPCWTTRIGEALNKIEAATFLPRTSEIVLRRGRRAIRRTPLLPRAIFVGVREPAHLDRVAAHAGVERILSHPIPRETTGNVPEFGLEPARIDAKILQRFVDALAGGEIVQPAGVTVGSHVIVLDGPFASFPGIVEALMPGDRVKVGVAIFGRSSPVELGLAEIQAVD